MVVNDSGCPGDDEHGTPGRADNARSPPGDSMARRGGREAKLPSPPGATDWERLPR